MRRAVIKTKSTKDQTFKVIQSTAMNSIGYVRQDAYKLEKARKAYDGWKRSEGQSGEDAY